MPKSQAELAAEFAALRRQLTKILGEVRPPDQVANVTFHIEVRSAIRFEVKLAA